MLTCSISAQQVVDKVKSDTKGGSITLIPMEQDKLASIKAAAETILKTTSMVNVLICNAGVMATPEGKTEDGFETQFGTNHLGHFYLFQLLKPALLASATPAFPSRVVALTSFSHRISPIRFDDYNFSKPDSYNPWVRIAIGGRSSDFVEACTNTSTRHCVGSLRTIKDGQHLFCQYDRKTLWRQELTQHVLPSRSDLDWPPETRQPRSKR